MRNHLNLCPSLNTIFGLRLGFDSLLTEWFLIPPKMPHTHTLTIHLTCTHTLTTRPRTRASRMRTHATQGTRVHTLFTYTDTCNKCITYQIIWKSKYIYI
jgi:hypothetical protein